MDFLANMFNYENGITSSGLTDELNIFYVLEKYKNAKANILIVASNIYEANKIHEKLDSSFVNSNLENTEVKKYIDNFSLLKKDIDILLNSKNPVSFIFQLKKIKDNFMIHLENIIDYIEKEISMDNNEKHKLLYDL